MARCPDCNKFVSYDDGTEPEAEADVDETGHITGTVRIALTCAECGTELREASFDLDVDLSAAVEEHREKCRANQPKLPCADCGQPYADHRPRWPEEHPDALNCPVASKPSAVYAEPEADDSEHEMEVEVDDCELTSRTEGKGRGLKTFYGYHAAVHVRCSCGDFESDTEASEDTQASSMEEIG